MLTATKTEIARVNFTYALPSGMWVERKDGSREWLSFGAIVDEVGQAESDRLTHIAVHGGMTGMWYNATNGGHVYVNGQEVN